MEVPPGKNLSKNKAFRTFLVLLRLDRTCLVRKCVNRTVLMCQRQTGKIPCLNPIQAGGGGGGTLIDLSSYLYIIRCLLSKYRLIFFTSLESRRVKYRKTSTNISRYFKIRHLIIYLLSNSKNFTPGVKRLEFKSNRRHQDFPESKIYTNHSNQNIFGGR